MLPLVFTVSRESMKRILLIIIPLCLLSACSVVQILFVSPNSNGIHQENKQFVFENDTLKIIYSFWEQQGVMSFVIENKLEIPIYIDWKKSSFISLKTKLDYYSETEITKSSNASASAAFIFNSYYDWGKWYPGVLGLSESVAIKYKQERITFIPPHAITERSTYRILPGQFVNMDNAIKGKSNSEGKELISTPETAFITFRNFLTYSTKESFETERYINNEFYVRKVLQTTGNHLANYEDAKRFYLKLQ